MARASIFSKLSDFERRMTKNFTPKQKKLYSIFIFLAKFTALSLPLHFLLWLNFDAMPLQEFVARAVSWMLSLSGISAAQSGVNLAVATVDGPLLVEIIRDCVGWKSMLALFGLIFATPKVSMRRRLIGLAIGAPIIFLLNLVRIWSTIYITAAKGYGFWEITHTILWQEGLIIAVIGVWWVWMKKYAARSG